MTCTPTCVKPSPSNAHCSACHETFGSVSGFDRHRRAGACVDPVTIPGQRLTDGGIWRYEGGENRADAHSRSRSEPESDESGSAVPESTPEPEYPCEGAEYGVCGGQPHTEACPASQGRAG